VSTAVFFHAHPDDEALLTSGTMARAAAQGHRVVLVVATDGALGLAADRFSVGRSLAEARLDELRASAQALGVARVEHLGYADSGMGPDLPSDPPGGRRPFVSVDDEEAAQKLAAILRQEHADVLTSYDENGGYGHRDHVKVHRVAVRAAELAGTPRHLLATVPRDAIARVVELGAKILPLPPGFDPTSYRRAYAPSADITHRIDVRKYTRQKRASMAAHVSQTTGGGDGGGLRTLGVLLRLPRPLFAIVAGREWYVDASRVGQRPVARDIFEGLTVEE
jgi:LmbE family N-acetylglucosaminyl deacetylase